MHTHHRVATRRVRRLAKRQVRPTAPLLARRRERLRQALRDAQVQAQVDLAQRLQLTPAAIATLEHHTDMYITNLRRCLASLGGTLEIVVHFPKGRVSITQFGEIDTVFL
jgi:ribosome-binding protein aMBF1 (putative translation factor)